MFFCSTLSWNFIMKGLKETVINVINKSEPWNLEDLFLNAAKIKEMKIHRRRITVQFSSVLRGQRWSSIRFLKVQVLEDMTVCPEDIDIENVLNVFQLDVRASPLFQLIQWFLFDLPGQVSATSRVLRHLHFL